MALKDLRLDLGLVVGGEDKLISAARLSANDKLDHFTPERWIAHRSSVCGAKVLAVSRKGAAAGLSRRRVSGPQNRLVLLLRKLELLLRWY